jgi:ATP-dependent DNA helicase RecG
VPDATPTTRQATERLIEPLMAPVTGLRGCGPSLAVLLARVTGGTRVIDVLFHMPESFVDRRLRPTIKGAQKGTVATLEVEVVRHEAPATPRQPWRVVVTDGTGFAELVFFKPQRAQSLLAGTKLLVSGKVELFADRVTMPHPDHIVPADQPERLPALEPVWPLTAGLFPSQVRSVLTQALALIPPLPEWHDAALMRCGRCMHRWIIQVRNRARGWPTMNCWRTRWRWHGCARANAGGRGARCLAPGRCARWRWGGSGIH